MCVNCAHQGFRFRCGCSEVGASRDLDFDRCVLKDRFTPDWYVGTLVKFCSMVDESPAVDELHKGGQGEGGDCALPLHPP